VDLAYECSVLLLTGSLLLARSTPIHWRFAAILCLLPAWGFLQLAAGATVYRHATLQSALQLAALSATAWICYSALGSALIREYFLVAVAWFGFLVAIVSVLAYYTSPGQVLWSIHAPYPDVWGPFLSRNNFAQFLELTLPVALWLALQRPRHLLYWAMSASMLAAGLASASRAGAILLCLETVAAFWLAPRRDPKLAAWFSVAVLVFASVAGVGTLLGRFTSDPLAERSQIYQSTLAMISERPAQGYGLGTFATVYPEFALFDSGYTIEYAHSDWLEWTCEGGLGFTAVWVLLAIPVMPKMSHHFWGLGIPAVFLHALADFPFARLGIGVWVFIMLGAIERTRLPAPPLHRRTT
jgi:O-antigen ligase